MFGKKPQAMKAILSVKEKKYLSPHFIRIVLEGDIDLFSDAKIGDNNKIIIPKNNEDTFILPSLEKNNTTEKPIIRTYTTRDIDFENKTLTIDFVAHGENSPASRWAIHAEKGHKLGVLMKVKSKPLYKDANWYLLVGDHTALPVISVMLEKLPKETKGKAIIEVHGPEDALELKKPVGFEIEWIFNKNPGEEQKLIDAFSSTSFPDCSKYIFVACEYTSAKQIREYSRTMKETYLSSFQILSYWKHGQSEESSAEERRKERVSN
ncbi:siderophore-interacting protein [Chishuiella sp.]|uniref:siderophore-interacting protein n=1 Tax=Chishuiella sp. TaxID=1969467 RepID=UPI0028AC2ABD|nr:siderophore-interacting protein [Chishuiella sp.]